MDASSERQQGVPYPYLPLCSYYHMLFISFMNKRQLFFNLAILSQCSVYTYTSCSAARSRSKFELPKWLRWAQRRGQVGAQQLQQLRGHVCPAPFRTSSMWKWRNYAPQVINTKNRCFKWRSMLVLLAITTAGAKWMLWPVKPAPLSLASSSSVFLVNSFHPSIHHKIGTGQLFSDFHEQIVHLRMLRFHNHVASMKIPVWCSV